MIRGVAGPGQVVENRIVKLAENPRECAASSGARGEKHFRLQDDELEPSTGPQERHRRRRKKRSSTMARSVMAASNQPARPSGRGKKQLLLISAMVCASTPMDSHCWLILLIDEILPKIVVEKLALVKPEAHGKQGDPGSGGRCPSAHQAGDEADPGTCAHGDPRRPLSAHIENHYPGAGHSHQRHAKDAYWRHSMELRIPAGIASMQRVTAEPASSPRCSRRAPPHSSGQAGLVQSSHRPNRQVEEDRRPGKSSYLPERSGGSGCRSFPYT